jgi:hypothetical protein
VTDSLVKNDLALLIKLLMQKLLLLYCVTRRVDT